MATWTISDNLDARLRKHLGIEDPAAYAERVLADHLDCEQDPEMQAIVDADIAASEADIKAGRITDARQAMMQIADEFGINVKR